MVVGEHPRRVFCLRPPLLPKLPKLAIKTTQHAAIVVSSRLDDVPKRLPLHLDSLADVLRQPFFTRCQALVDAFLKPLAESLLETRFKPLALLLEALLQPIAESLLEALLKPLTLLLEAFLKPLAQSLLEALFEHLASLLEALLKPLAESLFEALLELSAQRDKLHPNFISQCPLQLVEAVGHLFIPLGRHRSIVLLDEYLRTEGHVE